MDEPVNPLERFVFKIYKMIDGPVTLFREKIVEPNQKKYPWYHEKFRRVPTIDECYPSDYPCIFEANEQFLRDKAVDDNILSILRKRYESCLVYYRFDKHKCDEIKKMYFDAEEAWFIKYGDLGFNKNVRKAYMKQKHRMVWERRHGPVGSGMKEE